MTRLRSSSREDTIVPRRRISLAPRVSPTMRSPSTTISDTAGNSTQPGSWFHSSAGDRVVNRLRPSGFPNVTCTVRFRSLPGMVQRREAG